MLVSYFKFYGIVILVLLMGACATGKNKSSDAQPTIENPFADYHPSAAETNQNITLRSTYGNESTEVQFPGQTNSDMVIPMSSRRGKDSHPPQVANVGEVDYQYKEHKATAADREIASTFTAHQSGEDEVAQRDIEENLGLQNSDEAPAIDQSYLAQMDVVKQLFKNNRYEAALIETDQMIKIYPTNSRLYEMRGTLLDRMGYSDLALRSWKQAAELDPKRLSLKKTIEKREAQRSVASEGK